MSDELKPKKIRRYGYIPDLPDPRDQRLPTLRSLKAMPDKYDMTKEMPAIWDQGELGSCTAHAALACFQFTAKEQKQRAVNYSRLYQYYNTRVLENTVDWDSGATIRNSIKAINKAGVALESAWPYKQTKFAKKPPEACYEYGSKKILRSYARVNQTFEDIRACLAQNNPITFGFSVFDSFEGDEIANTGVMRMPGPGERVIGGHAVVMTGYDTSKEVFICRNSWSKSWGDNGSFYMPFEFALDPYYADDFWAIFQVP